MVVDGSEEEVVEEFGVGVGPQVAALCSALDQMVDFLQAECDDAFAECVRERASAARSEMRPFMTRPITVVSRISSRG